MRKITLWLSVLLCAAALTVSVSAEDALFALDWADLLTNEEEAALNTYLAEISERNSANIIVATVDSTEGTDAQSYADDLYDAGLTYFGLMDGTEDGALFLVAMNERAWAVSTTGYGITVITEQALDQMEYAIVPYLSDGAYYDAFAVFGELCDLYWQGDPDAYDSYDYGYGSTSDIYGGGTERYSSSFGAQWIFISLIAGFLIALIPMGILKSQLYSVHMQSGAASYQTQDSVRITNTEDLFLYRHMSKRPIPRDPPSSSGSSRSGGSIHISSSGRSHGGRSGGF